MRCTIVLILIALLCSMTFEAWADDERQTVEWLVVDWLPSWIFKGAERNQGYGDLIEEQLFQLLDAFHHEKRVVTFARLVNLLGRDENVCTSTGFYQWPDKNGVPREDLVWSAPVLMFEWHGLVIPENKIKSFGALAGY